MTEPTYTDRRFETHIVTEIRDSSICFDDNMWWNPPPEVLAKLSTGLAFGMETRQLSRVVGIKVDGAWVWRKSDQELAQERREFVEKMDRDRREQLEANRSEWVGRTEQLPGWLQDRIQTFRERGGENFEVNGWGYELVVCELAALYDADPNFIGQGESYTWADEAETIKEYAEREGTSGNQHDCARALVRHHRAGETLAGTISALSPLTGDAFYEGTQ